MKEKILFIFYLFHNQLWRDILHAGKVATHARLVAIDAAWAARHIELYGIVGTLMPAHETGVWMGGSPDTYHWGIDQRCQMHVAAVHTDHQAEMTHQDEFVGNAVELA